MGRNLVMGLVALAVLLAAGCGKVREPRAGGKPVEHWVGALRAPDVRLRKTAALKLGNVGASDPAALPALVQALDDPDPAVRCEVILALVKFGPAAREAVPALARVGEHDRNARVRRSAALALKTMQSPEGVR